MGADDLGGDRGDEQCVGDLGCGVMRKLEQAGFGIAGGDGALGLNDGGEPDLAGIGAAESAEQLMFTKLSGKRDSRRQFTPHRPELAEGLIH